MKKLGKTQTAVYEFIKKEIRDKGYPPSVREICDAVGLLSTSTAHQHLTQLQKKGYIHRDPEKTRAIEILDPDFYSFRKDLVDIPILGKVTAGDPITAVENFEGMFTLPSEYATGQTVFMLRVKGDSMIDAGIRSNDLVIVRGQRTASNGQIVVALIEDSATVKRFYKEKNYFRLQPENDSMEPIVVDEVEIVGIVIGLFRSI